ncbi:pentapeptide repeat-containing protein, partial [Planktothrix agardhii]
MKANESIDVDKLLTRYATGERNFSGIHLMVACLKQENLNRINLSNANLQGTNLSRARLIGANFNGADLSQVNLTMAVLVEA